MAMGDFGPLGENDTMQLEHLFGKDSIRIDRLGARLALKINGIQLLTSFDTKRYDGNPAVTHPCTPVFGNFGQEYRLPQHGPARKAVWELVSYTPGLEKGETLLRYSIAGGTYPEGMIVTQQFALEKGVFTLETEHQNNGVVTAPVNYGEHFYWWTNYAGWDNVTLNGKSIAALIAQNGQTELQHDNELVIPHHAVIRLEQEGLSHAVAWSMPHSGQGALEFDRHYFCLEPVERPPEDFGKPETLLQSGQTRRTKIKISLIENLHRS